jgi:hypothetical protein
MRIFVPHYPLWTQRLRDNLYHPFNVAACQLESVASGLAAGGPVGLSSNLRSTGPTETPHVRGRFR